MCVPVRSVHCILAGHRESLPPDMAGKKPLSMDQYHLLYACCRIPCEKVDVLRRTPPNLALHGIVGHNGHVSVLYVQAHVHV